jgi:bifunctional DNase/RNase
MENKIKELLEEFFQKLNIKIDSIEIIEQKENIYLIKIRTPES